MVMITYLNHSIQHMALDTLYSTLVLSITFQHTSLHLALDTLLDFILIVIVLRI